ncbi:MAG TPA: cytidine deaminase [Pilimelia sp.]|nr:cytidine deaminase [Pilimelia sp.]
MTAEIDWPALRAAATEAMRRAYAPYSRFPVGAAALVDDGRVVAGCNVENAGYGVTLCAECGVVSALHAGGGGRLLALACVDATGTPLMPCGRCRQLLWEHGGPDCLVDALPAPLPMAELLPFAFDVADLTAVTGADPGPGRPTPAIDVPARLAAWRGRGTVFVHPDLAGGERVWTGYWERSSGALAVDDDAPSAAGAATPPAGGTGILDEAPTWRDVADAIAWGLARTPRVVVVDADGGTWWAGDGEPPAEVPRRWARA